MKKIISTNSIIEANINHEHYFLSFIELLKRYGKLQDYEVEKIQYDAMLILRSEVQRYTLGESSSVRVETAESLFLSIQYILGLYFNNIGNLEKSMDILKKGNLNESYIEGKKILDLLFEKTKFKMNMVECNKISTENYAYNDTVEYGLPLFFKLYDKKFAAHEIPGSIDYPLYLEEINLSGVEFIAEYLRRISIEDRFCSRFSQSEIMRMLKSYDKEADELLINIFSMVLLNSLASMLVGKGGSNLRLTEGDLVYLKTLLPKLNRENTADFIMKLLLELKIDDKEMEDYILAGLDKLISRINIAVELNKLNTIFIVDRERQIIEPIAFIDSKKMSNDDFKKVFEEIIECNEVKEKIQIIRENIKSLEDLVDILDSECIYGEEYIEIFDELSDEEIALVMKFSMLPIEESKFAVIDKEWQIILYEYINKTHKTRKESIINICEGLANY